MQACTGKMCVKTGRDQGEAADANEGQRLLPVPQKLRERNGTEFPFMALKSNQCGQQLDLGFLALGTKRQCLSVAYATQSITRCYSSPSKLTQIDY